MSGERVLTIDLAGERREVQPSEVLTFGRAADLVVDEANPYLHRIVGRFFWHGESWWLENLGRAIELEVVVEGGTVSRLPARDPDATPVVVALAAPAFWVRFEGGGFPYELVGTIGSVELPVAGPGSVVAGGTETFGYAAIPLTDDERLLLVRLAEPCLRDPTRGAEDLPANRVVAEQLGWSLAKFNRKLDYLCYRLAEAGVRGLHGQRGEGQKATNRRWRLVEHAINARLIKPTDLDSLE